MTNCGIYKISSPNGFYIGSSKRIAKRKCEHFSALRAKKHYNGILQRAFNKYGDLMGFSVIEFCHIDELLEREQFYIDSLKPKYNICKVAGRMDGYRFSDEQKERMRGRKVDGSKISAGVLRNTTKEQRVAWSKKARSMWTEESKEKQKKSLTGRKMSPEAIEKIRSRLTGRSVSKETRDKIAMQKGWKHSPESIEVMRRKKLGRTGELCPNSKVIYCSNGMKFNGSYDAQRWLRGNGHPKAHAGRVTSVCRGERNKTYGLLWSYAEFQ